MSLLSEKIRNALVTAGYTQTSVTETAASTIYFYDNYYCLVSLTDVHGSESFNFRAGNYGPRIVDGHYYVRPRDQVVTSSRHRKHFEVSEEVFWYQFHLYFFERDSGAEFF